MIKTFMTRWSHIHTKSCWTLIKSFASESFDTGFKSVQPLQWGDFFLSDQPHLQPFCQWPPILQTIYFSRSQNFYQFFPTFPLFSFPVNSYIAFFLLLWHPCTIHHPMLAPVLISLLLPICSFESPEKISLLGKECKINLPHLHGLVCFPNDKNTKMFVGHSEGVLAYFSLTDSTICYHLLVHPFLPFLSCCTNFQKWWLCQQQILQQILYPCVKNHFKGTCTLFGYGHMWVLKHWSVIGITISHVLDCSPVSLSGLWSK